MNSSSMRRRNGWRLIAVLVFALAVGACNSEQSPSTDDPAIDVPAGSEQTSSTIASGSASDNSPPPTLTIPEPGENAPQTTIAPSAPDGLEVGFTEEGYPYRGSPNAPVTLIEYSDYACPFCGRYTAENVPALLEQYGVTGDVRFVFRDL
ncbi:MAG: thioredoxin domain-containing protein, partial [Actinomycetota bacterium]|nr:thioredoxin domain-containing protein [Actinomycetota bacterium]